MATVKIKVNTSSLNHTKQEMQSRLSQIKDAVSKIEGDMTTLNSVWDGDAHKAFVSQVEDDLKVLEEACKEIEKIIEFEDKAVSEYDKCEQQVGDLVNSIQV